MATFTKYASIVVPLGTATCLAYLFGYWGPLGVNVLEHIALSDVVRLSLYPMLVSLSFLFLGMIVGSVTGPYYARTFGSKREEPLPRWARLVVVGGWGLMMIAGIVWGKEPHKWLGMAMLLALSSNFVASTPVLVGFIPDGVLRPVLVYLVLLVPPMAFAFGRINADKIVRGEADRVLDTSRFESDLPVRASAEKPIMYAGRLGDRVILYETLTEHVVLVREDRVPLLAIGDNPLPLAGSHQADPVDQKAGQELTRPPPAPPTVPP